jgi:hypothetical protein
MFQWTGVGFDLLDRKYYSFLSVVVIDKLKAIDKTIFFSIQHTRTQTHSRLTFKDGIYSQFCMKIQSVLHRKHVTSPLQSPTG